MDNNFTNSIKNLILAGNVLSLKGSFFEGYHQSNLFHKFIGASAANHFRRYNPLYPFMENIVQSFEAARGFKWERPADLYRQGKFSLVTTGWAGHETKCIFWKNICLKINTGEGSGRSPGIQFFTMEKYSSEIVAKVISKLTHRDTINDRYADYFESFFNQGIDKELGLKFQTWVYIRQKVDNCGWMSSKAFFLALLILGEISENTKNFEEINSEIWRVFKNGPGKKRVFKEFSDNSSSFQKIKIFLNSGKRHFLHCCEKFNYRLSIPLLYERYTR